MDTCEICRHEIESEDVEVLELWNEYHEEMESFWACPDCAANYTEDMKCQF